MEDLDSDAHYATLRCCPGSGHRHTFHPECLERTLFADWRCNPKIKPRCPVCRQDLMLGGVPIDVPSPQLAPSPSPEPPSPAPDFQAPHIDLAFEVPSPELAPSPAPAFQAPPIDLAFEVPSGAGDSATDLDSEEEELDLTLNCLPPPRRSRPLPQAAVPREAASAVPLSREELCHARMLQFGGLARVPEPKRQNSPDVVKSRLRRGRMMSAAGLMSLASAESDEGTPPSSRSQSTE
jgi:hypothetical protein